MFKEHRRDQLIDQLYQNDFDLRTECTHGGAAGGSFVSATNKQIDVLCF